MANISADIYEISEFMNDIKKNFSSVPNDTHFMETFGYLNEAHSQILQNAIVMAAEYSNEGIPVKAKFEKNIITHALSLEITDINATPAKMTVLLGFLEVELVNAMRNDKFVFDKDYKIYIEDYEFHTEYDIIIGRNLLPNGEYTYTAQYDMSRKNSLSTVTNPYLTPPAKLIIENDPFIYVQCDIRQYEQEEIYKKVLTDNPIENKTINFEFESQIASFEIDVVEGTTTTHLVPMYEGLYKNISDKYFYYSYIDSSTIRIKFDRDSYEPRINADVTINLKTTQGLKGNFTYKDELAYNMSSERFGYSNITVSVKPISNSEFGTDKKSIDDLKKIIPKEGLARGSITNTSDLENFFNMIETSSSKLYFYKKRDNQLERVYYSYLLLKDKKDMIVPTNTISILLKEDDFISTENDKYIFDPGRLIYYNCFDLPYGVVGPSAIGGRIIDPTNPISLLDINETPTKSTYAVTVSGFDRLIENTSYNVSITIKATDVVDNGGYNKALLKFAVTTPDGGALTMKIKDSLGNIEEVISKGYYGKEAGFNLSNTYNSTLVFDTMCTVSGIYTITISLVDLENESTVITSKVIHLNIGGFIYTTPFMCVLNMDPLYVSYYMNIIDMVKYLGFDYINQNCKLQFISTHVNWKRKYLEDRNVYKLDITLMQNIASDEGMVVLDDSDNITEVNLKIFAILYNDSIPYRYIEATLVDYDSEAFSYDFRFEFLTNDVMSEENMIRIENLKDIGTTNTSYGYLNSNTKTVLYILSKQDLQYGRDDADIYIPNLDGYTLSNKYSINNGLDFFFNYSHMISSNVTPSKDADGKMTFLVNEVPVVRQSYVDTEENINNFIYQVEKRKEYINYSLSILEDSFGIDFKFFNTYGPSNIFFLDEAHGRAINKVNLSMKFKIKVVANTDKYIKDYIVSDIKEYIEDINEITDLHIPNLITDITNKYREQIVYFEFLSMNDNGPGYQHIYQKDVEYFVGVVPEFLNINTLDDGTPDIDITIV